MATAVLCLFNVSIMIDITVVKQIPRKRYKCWRAQLLQWGVSKLKDRQHHRGNIPELNVIRNYYKYKRHSGSFYLEPETCSIQNKFYLPDAQKQVKEVIKTAKYIAEVYQWRDISNHPTALLLQTHKFSILLKDTLICWLEERLDWASSFQISRNPTLPPESQLKKQK